MRVLFTTPPGSGHVHPMVPLARAVLDRGAEVCWAVAPAVCARLHEQGFEARPAGLDDGEGFDEFYRRYPELQSLPVRDRPAFMFPRIFGAVRAPHMLTDLLPIVDDWKPSLIVRDAAEFAAPIAATVAGVPSVTHSFGELLPREKVAGAGVEMAPLWEARGLEAPAYGARVDDLYLDIYPPSLHAGAAEPPPLVQALRPVAFAMDGDEDVPDWLASSGERPVVYVTFGTVFNKDVALISRVVEALRELDVRVVATVGPTGDPTALGEQPANVHVARYIPQTQLLPVCAAVASHSGSGTFLAALARGLPQLCLPQAADQFENASACARAGAGISLDPDECSVDAVRGAAQRVLSEPTIKAAAMRLSGEIAAMPDPTTVAMILQERFGP